MSDSPIDEYYFWKKLIEDKQELSEPVPERMLDLLALAEIKMIQYLIKKHQLSENLTSTIDLH